jgi:hypothetical protein
MIMSLTDYNTPIEEYQWKTQKHYSQLIEDNRMPRSMCT